MLLKLCITDIFKNIMYVPTENSKIIEKLPSSDSQKNKASFLKRKIISHIFFYFFYASFVFLFSDFSFFVYFKEILHIDYFCINSLKFNYKKRWNRQESFDLSQTLF
ncbi:hypothetical protein ACKWTF_000990 [Chironomus riparius]